MKGQQQWEYLPPDEEKHRARRHLVILGAVAVGTVIGWRLGR